MAVMPDHRHACRRARLSSRRKPASSLINNLTTASSASARSCGRSSGQRQLAQGLNGGAEVLGVDGVGGGRHGWVLLDMGGHVRREEYTRTSL